MLLDLPITLNDEPVAVKLTASPDLTPMVRVAGPTLLPSVFLKSVAVTTPTKSAPPEL